MTQLRTNEFIAPPECPVFEPSWEEFADPFAYINKIRPIAEKTGICKVRPPKGWQPPFACDVDSLHFTPRIQRLNELEAQTRVKLNFLDQIAKFWELQGCTLKIPHVERKILDLYQLNKLVNDEGGFDAVCRERRWSKIALKMGFAPGKAIGSHLRSHYERILYPYNLFQTGANLLVSQMGLSLSFSHHPCIFYSLSFLSHSLSRPLSCVSQYSLLKVLPVQVKQEATEHEEPITSDKENMLTKKNDPTVSKAPFIYCRCVCLSQVDQYMCLVCGSGSEEDRLLLCDGCDDSYHTFCLIPPLHDVPKGDWRCPKCLAQECCKPQVAFGFEQAGRDYSLRTFGDMADSFKSDYFNMPVHMVPTELVEKEFWRLVSTIEEDVTVEYGADIASKEFGSGFPIRGGRFQVSPEDEDYLSSGWNLNNMPVMDSSVLTHITADICGMKLPWLYVGMCFSSFCWHIEDHWSYSINYLHWGEPKTWYGVPGYAAEKLEWVMRKLAPELFESQPDLLHQLVTIMNPNTLMNHGVPIYRTNQCSGEFVITFPRAYHSGFNQGFNFAEAVNFCTMDWMPMGRMCVDHYRQLNRYCVFSHDEMVCKMASKADTTMDVALASAVQRDMTVMLQEEDKLRDKVSKMGVQRSQQAEYDLLPDEERQCSKCRTTCYLSALTCPCSPGQLVCLHHAHDLCSCTSSELTLNYRFTMAELYPMMEAVTLRAESYTYWVSHVSGILEAKQDKKSGLEELRSLVVEAEVKRFPQSDLLRQLRTVTLDAEKCAVVAQQLLIGKRQTSQNLLTVEELRSFVRQLHNLPCSIRQAPLLKDLLTRVDDFQQSSEQLLSDEAPSPVTLQGLLDLSLGLDVELPQLALLRERLEQARWLDGVKGASVRPHSLCLDTMRRLIDQGVGLAPHGSVERAMARLQELLTMSEHWEERALRLMEARPRHCVETLVEALQEVASIPAYLPNCLLLKDTVDKAKDWLQEAETLQLGGRIPVLDTLTDLVSRAKAIPVWLDPLARLDSLVFDVQAWKESAAKTFLMKNSAYSLLEVLCPRCEAGTGPQQSKYKRAKDAAQCSERNSARLDCLSDVERALSESKDSASAVRAVRQKEMESLLALRASNESKLLLAGDCGALRVCVCHKAPSGAMLQCELCRDAFHRSCVLGSNQDPLPNQAWVCPQCQLSEKPPLDRVLPLLASLQRIRVRLPEGDALRFLIERTVRWQHRVQQASAEGVAVTTSNQRWASSSPTWHWQIMVDQHGGSLDHHKNVYVHSSVLIMCMTFMCGYCYQNGVVCPKKEAVNGKRTKRHMEEEGSERKDKAKKPRKKKPKLNKERSQEAKGTSSLTATHSDLSLSDSDEDFTLCAAPWCREPEGKQVNWVQCDGSCQQWFHQVCVGVSAEQAEKEDYICISCTQPDHTRE
uniref:[histone H3]-trimethyl-L-lysine(4) demethylase n=1 Tax=Oncorhynchus tshawytscha TaxID=74940 RepID=A0A8C8EGT3_ONCTS